MRKTRCFPFIRILSCLADLLNCCVWEGGGAKENAKHALFCIIVHNFHTFCSQKTVLASVAPKKPVFSLEIELQWVKELGKKRNKNDSHSRALRSS